MKVATAAVPRCKVIDELLDKNMAYAGNPANAGDLGLPIRPSKRVAVVACMDARLDVEKLLGLSVGEAHVIRNAGGVITEDAIRSDLRGSGRNMDRP